MRVYKSYKVAFDSQGYTVYLSKPLRKHIYMTLNFESAFKWTTKTRAVQAMKDLQSFGYTGVTLLTETKVKRYAK